MISIVILLCVLFLYFGILCCSGSDFEGPTSLHNWLQTTNEQYLLMNQLSASYAWQLMVDPDFQLYDKAQELGKQRSKWQNQRCTEAHKFPKNTLTDVQQRMIWILCRGPKYTEFQGGELSSLLGKIQNIYTSTEICIPKAFDVCLNLNRIWDYTYIKHPKGDIMEMNLQYVAPKAHDDPHPLNYFHGNISRDYFVFRGGNGKSRSTADTQVEREIRKSEKICLNIEPDLENIMEGNVAALQRLDCALPGNVMMRWAWETWRLAVGPEILKYYPNAVYLMNLGARNNGYNDIGECWREELEIPDIENVTKNLWIEVKPYYKLLHAILRNALHKKFQRLHLINRKGPLPAHLLGNMWSQDWSIFNRLLLPKSEVYIEDNFRNTNWSVIDMVSRAEDFYTSMGLKAMPSKFWKNSRFTKSDDTKECHGSAGNMFTGDDYRMLLCAQKSLKDFYVIVHEMGHIEYYMHLTSQPPIFQDATNSMMGEALGDAIFLAMMNPQHLHRLGLLNDKFLMPTQQVSTKVMRCIHETSPFAGDSNVLEKLNISDSDELYAEMNAIHEEMRDFMRFKDANDKSMNAFDLSLLLRLALEKIPHIPFELILDQWRWKYFRGDLSSDDANDYFWKMSIEEQGIYPPDWVDRHYLFDVAAKYHVADNTPYMRYFLSSFLQVQIFKGLCEKTLFGRFNSGRVIPMPLHRCDIYGSKRAGHILKKALSLGSSVHWSEVLFILTGTRNISSQPFVEFYEPLFRWLEKLLVEYDIPVGW